MSSFLLRRSSERSGCCIKKRFGIGYNKPMNTETKRAVAQVESKRGRNHPLDQFAAWLTPETGGWRPAVTIQVIGTNGKGSVSWMLMKGLQNTGKKVGLFTSPHLLEHFERIRINGVSIPEDDWMDLYTRYTAFFEKEKLTMFEIDLFMAMVYFEKQGCDAIVLEAGLGGGRDATTAIEKDLLCYTGTGLDHMAYLGNTLYEITESKAGAFRPGVPVYCSETRPEIIEELRQQAQKTGCDFHHVGSEEDGQKLREYLLRENPSLTDHFPPYQGQNALLAYSVLHHLDPEMDPGRFAHVMADFRWPGRYEVIRRDPLLVVDGAHNEQGIRALCEGLQPHQFTRCYFSVLADKQGQEMIQLLKEKIDRIILVEFESTRLADLHELAAAEKLTLIPFEKLKTRLDLETEPTLVCGSLYFVAEVLRMDHVRC